MNFNSYSYVGATCPSVDNIQSNLLSEFLWFIDTANEYDDENLLKRDIEKAVEDAFGDIKSSGTIALRDGFDRAMGDAQNEIDHLESELTEALERIRQLEDELSEALSNE